MGGYARHARCGTGPPTTLALLAHKREVMRSADRLLVRRLRRELGRRFSVKILRLGRLLEMSDA
jgi:hypothetical protein